MMTLGQFQQLYVVKEVAFGVYLCETPVPGKAEEVLLPANEFSDGTLQTGDRVGVFLYKDSNDRLIATLKTPKITLGAIARLTVSSVTNIGAFLDWGLPKDLLLPFAEQTARVKISDTVIVALYIDKSERLCATMRLYDYLRSDTPYKKGDHVRGIVYQVNPRYGAFVAVEDAFSALVPNRELVQPLNVGDVIRARVTQVRDDGRLNLSLREAAHLQMDVDAAHLLTLLEAHGKKLPLHDRSAPEDIRQMTGMSKAQFKRAVGRLMKEHKVMLSDDAVCLAGEEEISTAASPRSPHA